jgi:hypothetical protein
MRPFSLLLWFLVIAAAQAQPARQVTPAVECEPKRQSCVAECRAQYFAIDPRRTDCTVNCAAVAARCTREQSGE